MVVVDAELLTAALYAETCFEGVVAFDFEDPEKVE